MLFFKNMFALLWRYILGIIIAVLSCEILALIFKLTLITVQGPTMFTQVSDVVAFYIALSVSFFFLFRNYGIERLLRSMKEFLLYAIVTVVLHTIIIKSVDSWSGIWFVSTGTWTFVELMYTGGMIRLVESYTEIPRMYYYIALVIEDVCFIVFSLLGYCNGFHKTKNNSR